MRRKPKTYFFRRLTAFIIDFSIIYGIAFILYNVLQLFHLYLTIVKLTLITALIYYPVATSILKASIGKILLGLTIVNNSRTSYIKSIFFREVIYKQLFFILPISLILALNRLEWLSPFFEILCTLLMSFILFVIFLFTKRTWYDQLTKTYVFEKVNCNRSILKKGIFALAGICFIVFGIRTYFYSTAGSFNVSFVPKHSNKTLNPYVSFLKNQKSAKDYVFDLFDKNDIVVLCERVHPELTQYDFILDLVSDERFIQNVGNVFSEIGSKTQQSNLSKLISADSLSTNEFEYKLVKILQNLTQFPLWEYTNQYKYYSRLHAINQNLPSSKRINHYLNDIECNWYSIKTKQDYSIVKKRYYKREKILADNVIQKFEEIKNSNSERKKCLVIMNFRHAFGHVGNSNQIGDSWQTCASYLIKKYPDKVANVLLNTTKVSFGLSMPSIGPFFVPAQYSPINKGIWDNAFSEIGNKSLGFDFKKSPFGICQFDLFHMPIWKKYKYQDIFTGFVFYQPLNEHSFSYGFKDIIANGFDKEIVKRAILVDDKSTDPGLNLKYVNKRLKKLRTQEVTIDKKPYLQFESVFELIFGTTLLLLGLLLGFNGFMKRRKITKA